MLSDRLDLRRDAYARAFAHVRLGDSYITVAQGFVMLFSTALAAEKIWQPLGFSDPANHGHIEMGLRLVGSLLVLAGVFKLWSCLRDSRTAAWVGYLLALLAHGLVLGSSVDSATGSSGQGWLGAVVWTGYFALEVLSLRVVAGHAGRYREA